MKFLESLDSVNKCLPVLPNKSEWKKLWDNSSFKDLVQAIYGKCAVQLTLDIVKSLSFPIKVYALVGQEYQPGEDVPTLSERQRGISTLEMLSFDSKNNSITVRQDNDNYTFELGLDLMKNFVSGSGNDPCYVFVSMSKLPKVSRKSSRSSKVSRKSSRSSKVSRKSSRSSKVSRKSSRSSKVSRKSSRSPKVSRKSSRSPKVSRKSSRSSKVSRKSERSSKVSRKSERSSKVSKKSTRSSKV
jgi:hypothetical protein